MLIYTYLKIYCLNAMLLAHKIELRPTLEQKEYLDKACGSKRHCYNQLLAHFSKPENKWSKASAYQYYITIIRKEFEWYNEVSSRVTRNAIDDTIMLLNIFLDALN